MANSVTTQTLADSPSNVILLLTGVLDTSNEASAIKVDVSALTALPNGNTPTRVRIKRVQYSISGTLKVLLNWNATTDVRFLALSGQGEICFDHFGGLTNNAGTGVDGDVELQTVGYASGTETYTVILEMSKA